jgi:hypothetical protein
MKKRNKAHSVHDFIIFLKAKIAIIILGALLFSSITVYTQVDYREYWDVKLSRTVNRSAVMETMMEIQKNSTANAQKYAFNEFIIKGGSNISPVSFFLEMNKFVNSLMVNVLSNQDIKYKGIINSQKNEDVFKKQNYELVVTVKDVANEDLLKEKLNSFFLDIIDKSNQIIKMQNELDRTNNFKIYDFKIDQITKVSGFDKVKIIKIVLINFLLITFFVYIYHIRRFIKIF